MKQMKSKLFFTAAVSLFALATLFLTLFNYNPFRVGLSVFIVFYLSLLVSLTGISTFVILFVKSRCIPDRLSGKYFSPAIRQALLLSLIITALLLLKGLNILDLWVGIPLAVAIILLELFFRGNKYKKIS